MLPVMHADAARVDIGAEEVFVAVPADGQQSRCTHSERLPETYVI